MNHDELLARLYKYKSSNQGLFEMTDLYNWREALRAVLELHKPTPEPVFVSELECKICDSSYPCFTIQAIEKELK